MPTTENVPDFSLLSRQVLQAVFPKETRLAGPELLDDIIDQLPAPVEDVGGARADFGSIAAILANAVTIIVPIVQGFIYLRGGHKRTVAIEELRKHHDASIQHFLSSQSELTAELIRQIHARQDSLP